VTEPVTEPEPTVPPTEMPTEPVTAPEEGPEAQNITWWMLLLVGVLGAAVGAAAAVGVLAWIRKKKTAPVSEAACEADPAEQAPVEEPAEEEPAEQTPAE